MSVNKKVIQKISEYMEYEYWFKIPDSFIKDKASDIKGFIDIEELILKEFKFNQISDKNINDLFKIRDILNSSVYSGTRTELIDLGLGYSKDPLKSKGPTKLEFEKIKKFFKECSSSKNEEKFRIAKISGDTKLARISIDKITDFILKINEKNWKILTKLIIDKSISDLKLTDVKSDEIIIFLIDTFTKNNNINNNDKIFPYLIPMEITEVPLTELGWEFYIDLVHTFIKDKKDLKSKFNAIPENIENSSGSKIRNPEYNQKIRDLMKEHDLKEEILFSEFKTSKTKEKILDLDKIKEKIKNLDDLKDKVSLKYELSFILRDKKVLQNLGLKKYKRLFFEENKHKEFLWVYRKNSSIIYFSFSREKNINKKEAYIKNYINQDIKILKFSKTSKEKKHLTKSDIWNNIK